MIGDMAALRMPHPCLSRYPKQSHRAHMLWDNSRHTADKAHKLLWGATGSVSGLGTGAGSGVPKWCGCILVGPHVCSKAMVSP